MDKINPALFAIVLLVVALMAVGAIIFQRMAGAVGADLTAWKDNATACATSLAATTQQLNDALDSAVRSKDDVRRYDTLYVDVTSQLHNAGLQLNDTLHKLDVETSWRQLLQIDMATLQVSNNKLQIQITTLQQTLKEANAATVRCQNSLRACREATP